MMKKDLTSAVYWDNFGRGAISNKQVPSPREAADTVLQLMRERDEAECAAKVASKAALDAVNELRAPLMQADNEIAEQLERMKATFLSYNA